MTTEWLIYMMTHAGPPRSTVQKNLDGYRIATNTEQQVFTVKLTAADQHSCSSVCVILLTSHTFFCSDWLCSYPMASSCGFVCFHWYYPFKIKFKSTGTRSNKACRDSYADCTLLISNQAFGSLMTLSCI